MTRCKLHGSDYDGTIIDIDQPGDRIEYRGETYRRLTVEGTPHTDGLGRWSYRWERPVTGYSDQPMRRAP